MPRRAAKPVRKPRPARVAKPAAARGMVASKRALEAAVSGEGPRPKYVLRLYVTGTTPASVRAIEQVRKICEEHLAGGYDLEVIDLYQLPALAKDEQIIAAPTLIKVLPAPLRRFIGDLTKLEHVLFGLDLRKA